jgi:acyl-homoserine lactone acylase PvdQ
MPRTALALIVALLVAPAAANAAPKAYDVLPPGQFGGIPTTVHSTDQIPLYDGLTPLGRDVTSADISRFFKPETLGTVGPTTVEQTGRPGLTILRDSYGVPHITGKARDDVWYGAGFVTGEDRDLLLTLGRDPARAAVADIPGIDAFSLVTNPGQKFVPSAQDERLLAGEQRQIVKAYGNKGRQLLHDLAVYAEGVTAGLRKAGIKTVTWTVDDALATDAFIGSIFGNGGGHEVSNSRFLAQLRQRLGRRQGLHAWQDLMESNDPEAPVTTAKRFPYGTPGIGPTRGSLQVDPNSVKTAALAPQRQLASNFLVVGSNRSATGHPLFVAGPQLGFYYPEIVLEADLHGPGIAARGVLVPGGGPYVLIGRTRDYSWSLTSATNDNIDEFLLPLCRDSRHYVYKGHCRAMRTFDGGTLNGKPLDFPITVHGPVVGTATMHGRRYAIAHQRSTYGQDGNSVAALRDMTLGAGRTPQGFFRAANEFGFTFNWIYASRKHIAYFSSGRLPRRAIGLDPLLPTLGTGRYDWRGFLSLAQHPHQIDPRSGIFLNWNNKPAPGWTQGDDQHGYGAVQRVQLFRGFPRKVKLQDVVGIMNRAATQDLREEILWPLIRTVLGRHRAPNALTREAIGLLNAWLARGGSRLDRNLDGKIDDPGAAIMDAAWTPMAAAALGGQLDPALLYDLGAIEAPDQAPAGRNGSSFAQGWYEYLDKDLRTLLGQKVQGKFHLRYCGHGSPARCRTSLLAALSGAVAQLARTQGPDPTGWHSDATLERIHFTPKLIPNTMRWTNRSTYQQVISWR